jgi:nicotinamidase-related amidase
MGISQNAFSAVNNGPSILSEDSRPMALVIDVQDFDRMSPEDAKAYADHLAEKLADLRGQNPPVPVTWVAMRKGAQFYEPEDYKGTAEAPVRDEHTLTAMGFHGTSKEYKDFILRHGPRVNEAVVCKSVKSALLELQDAEGKPEYRNALEHNEIGGDSLDNYFQTNKTLADYMREQGVNKTLLMGAVSSHCVSETAVSGALKGFNPKILPDTVLSWHGDDNTVNPRTSLLLWRGTGASGPDKWDQFHQTKIEEKIRSIAADRSRSFSGAEMAAIQKIDFLTPSELKQTTAHQASHAQPSANAFSA